jgi:hypothetical protein
MTADSLHPVEAERAVLGSLILRPDIAEGIVSRLRPEDFTDQREVYAALLWRMFADRQPVDPQTVLAAVMQSHEIPTTDAAETIRGLTRSAFEPLSGSYYAGIVVQAVRRRRLHHAGSLLVQCAPTADIDELAMDTAKAMDDVLKDAGTDSEPSPAAEDLEGVEAEYDWIFPHVLERGDRLLVTAPEGGGKSVLVRQLAVCAAAGVDPFTGQHVKPRRVLMIDCENSELQSRRHLTPLLKTAAAHGRPTERRLRVQLRPGGLDLTHAPDASWLLRRVQVDNPELLCIGPLYRLHNADLNAELDARKVAAALDTARLRAGAALITETHAGHGMTGALERDLRPKGSQLWRAWPEMIRALRPVPGSSRVVSVEMAGRRDRDPRHWPEALVYGNENKVTDWPWMPTTLPETEARKPARAS